MNTTELKPVITKSANNDNNGLVDKLVLSYKFKEIDLTIIDSITIDKTNIDSIIITDFNGKKIKSNDIKYTLDSLIREFTEKLNADIKVFIDDLVLTNVAFKTTWQYDKGSIIYNDTKIMSVVFEQSSINTLVYNLITPTKQTINSISWRKAYTHIDKSINGIIAIMNGKDKEKENRVNAIDLLIKSYLIEYMED